MSKKRIPADDVAQELWQQFQAAKRGEIKTTDLVGRARSLEGVIRIHGNKLKWFQLASACPSQELKEELSVE